MKTIIETEYTMYQNDFYMILLYKSVANITRSFGVNSMKGKIKKLGGGGGGEGGLLTLFLLLISSAPCYLSMVLVQGIYKI